MGGCSLALTMILYLTESLYFRSSTLTFYVIFPCVLNCKFFFPIPLLLLQVNTQFCTQAYGCSVQFEGFSFSFFCLSLSLSLSLYAAVSFMNCIPHSIIAWFFVYFQQSRWLALFISRNGYDYGIHISIMTTKIRNCCDKWVASRNVGRQRKCLEVTIIGL